MQEFKDKPTDPRRTRIDHATGLLHLYETLQETNRHHRKSLMEFIKSFKGMITCFDQVMGKSKNSQVCELVLLKFGLLETAVANETSAFAEMFDKLLGNIVRAVKPVGKTMRERMYMEIDYQKFSTEHAKLKLKTSLTTKEYKRLYEVENKAKEAKSHLDSIDRCIEAELPLLLAINEKIANKLGVMVFLFAHQVYHNLWDAVRDLETFFPPDQQQPYAVTFYQGLVNDFHKQRQGIEAKVEFIGMLNFRQRAIESIAMDRPVLSIGRALYNFGGSKQGDLKFCVGDTIAVLEKRESGWWIARNAQGLEGEVPYNYFEFS